MIPTIDPRDRQLADMLIRYSTKTKPGELVFIMAVGQSTLGLAQACAEAAAKANAAPYIQFVDPEMQRGFLLNASTKVFQRLAQFELKQMQDADVFIGIRGSDNVFELSDVPRKQMDLYAEHVSQPVHMKERLNNTRWCVLRYPNSSMAQMASQSRGSFADFYYRVCLVDYAKMARDVKPLQALMNKTDRVRLISPGTDIEFSIKGIPAIPCCGNMNVPDGECFTSPVKNSVNGQVTFNAPSLQEGNAFDNVMLRFEDGKIVEAKGADGTQTRRLNEIFDQDAGSRYLGEFALAFNPQILHPMRDILFDEKIAGSFHMAVGNAYEDADNGNRSRLHWDLVCIQRPDYGGGEVWFDGKLIRRDGEFLPEKLQGLNRPKAAVGKSAMKK